MPSAFALCLKPASLVETNELDEVMREAKLIEIAEIPLANISISNRLRPVSDVAVVGLIESIETLGLQSEIHVRKIKRTGEIRLISGGHRVAAFQAMQRGTIPAKVWDCTDEWARLSEIDDNLAHAELDALELSVFLAARKEVYERAFPETKRGAAGNAARHGQLTDSLSVRSFAASSAEKLGVSERTIFRLLSAGQSLDEKEINALRAAPSKVSMSDLQEIAKCKEPSDRIQICKELAAGNAKSAREVLARKKLPGAAISDPVEDALKKLKDVYSRAPKEACRRFVLDNKDEFSEFLADDQQAEVVVFKRHVGS